MKRILLAVLFLLAISSFAVAGTITTVEPSGDITVNTSGVAAIKASVSLTTPIIGAATGTSLALTGNLTGLMPSVVVLIPSGVHDGGNDASLMTDGGIDIGASALVGMTVYNITDGSSCTITANAATTITCTLSGGTQNDWDNDDVWQVGPGPSQSGSIFYVAGAGTIRHPATVGYTAGYVADGTNKLTIDMASDSMELTTMIGTTNTAIGAGDCVDSSDTTIDDFMFIHNKSATAAKGFGVRGTWADGGAS